MAPLRSFISFYCLSNLNDFQPRTRLTTACHHPPPPSPPQKYVNKYGKSQSLHHHQHPMPFSACWPMRDQILSHSQIWTGKWLVEDGETASDSYGELSLSRSLTISKAISEFFNLSSSSSPITNKSSWLSTIRSIAEHTVGFLRGKKTLLNRLFACRKKRKERKLRHSKLPFCYEESLSSSWKETRRKTFPLELRCCSAYSTS